MKCLRLFTLNRRRVKTDRLSKQDALIQMCSLLQQIPCETLTLICDEVGTNAHSTVSKQHKKIFSSFCSWVQINSAFVSSHDKCILSLSLMWCLQWHIASCNYFCESECVSWGTCISACGRSKEIEAEGTIGEWSPIEMRMLLDSQILSTVHICRGLGGFF